jgi:hypothetical protein
MSRSIHLLPSACSFLHLAQVADFGTVREQKQKYKETMMHTTQSAPETHMSTQLVVGTRIYMPPECEYTHVVLVLVSFCAFYAWCCGGRW